MIVCILCCTQGHPAPSYGALPPHMYTAHSTAAASALTAHVAAAAAAAANHQQLSGSRSGGAGGHGAQGGSSSSRHADKPSLHKEDYVEVEKSNMVMLVSKAASSRP